MATHRSLFEQRTWSGSQVERQVYLDAISCLSHLAPDPLYDMLRTLRLREVNAVQPQRGDAVYGHVRAGINSFPAFAARLDTDLVAAHSTAFILTRAVDWVYLTACKARPGLLEEVVSFRGTDNLRQAVDAGPVILAAFHFGPSEILVGGIANRFVPVTVVVSDPSRRSARDGRRVMRSASEGDIESIQNGQVGALLSCLNALRRRRAVMIFPELSFADGAEQRTAVPFGGRIIHVPLGLATLAAKTGATILPCYVKQPKPGFYECTIGDPFASGKNLEKNLFAYCEDLIMNGLAAEWELWRYASQLLRGS